MAVDTGAYTHFIEDRELLTGIRYDQHIINTINNSTEAYRYDFLKFLDRGKAIYDKNPKHSLISVG
jgi:hypothetical protein